MGTWGTSLFADDLAADVRDGFRDLIGDGLSAADAVAKLEDQYATELDEDERRVFWLALGGIQFQLGRIEERTRREAVQIIESQADLPRWEDAQERAQRRAVLEKLRSQLLGPPPSPKKIPRTVRAATDWALGEVVALRVASGKWTLMRVIGYHADRGGRSAVCELLNWLDESLPSEAQIAALVIRRGDGISQFAFQEPRKQRDQERVRRLGFISAPQQPCGGYTALAWPYVDRQLKECFNIE